MKVILLVVISCMTFACSSSASDREPGTGLKILPVTDVVWEQLNPARGDKSPKAGTLWGDRKDAVPTGFLAQFVNGFSSPPHIHNATYRAVVISGLIHNDDPAAEPMWMPAVSFWTQPAGEVHITAAKGTHNLALVEIDEGPYLVKPTNDAFDNGEKPVNIDASNIVWTGKNCGTPVPCGPQIAYLWGSLEEGASYGTFLKLPAGFKGKLHSYGSVFHAVVVRGQLQHSSSGTHTLDPGSYFGSERMALHAVSSLGGGVIVYIHTNGKFELLADT